MQNSQEAFDPVAASKTIQESYRTYIKSTVHFSDRTIQQKLSALLDTPGFLAKGPYLEAAPPYQGCASTKELVENGVLCKSMLDLGGGNKEYFDTERPLYEHQVKAIQAARAGKNIVVTTGTGSGKTECFLLPILDDILREFEQSRPQPGVRAMILYPMNALANDQIKRIRELLSGLSVTFGRYTGDTKETQAEAEEAWAGENPRLTRTDNELISRQVMRKEPPNILLTNYSMLEYLLLRPEDSAFFSDAFGASWRHIAIDEAHVYSGARGTEIAYLLRRVKARIAVENQTLHHLHCYATSATIGSKSKTDLSRIAEFGQGLFGEPFFSSGGKPNVIIGTPDSPVRELREPWGSLPQELWSQLQSLPSDTNLDPEALYTLLKGSVPDDELLSLQSAPTPEMGLGHLLLGENMSIHLIKQASEGVIDLTPQDGNQIFEDDDIRSVGSKLLTDMAEVLARAQRNNGTPVLSSRYHFFLRGPVGLFINLYTDELLHEKHVSQSVDGLSDPVPIYELAACRHCGEAYLLGSCVSNIDAGIPYLDPKPVGEDPANRDQFDPRLYFRLLKDAEDADDLEEVIWLCPACGSIHNAAHGGEHLFSHPEISRIPIAQGSADEDNSKCPHCRYSDINAIQPLRVSPEAVGSVVCYDLVREVPPFQKPLATNLTDPVRRFKSKKRVDNAHMAGNVICFSDRRQDAAYFAPAMERTYNDLTIRQILRTAVSELYDGVHGVKPSAVCSWLSTIGVQRFGLLITASQAEEIACSWVLGELMTHTPRNSLEGLGTIRIEPTSLINSFSDNEVRKYAQEDIDCLGKSMQSWLSVDDYLVLLRYCIESIRKRGGLIVPQGVDGYLKDRTKVRPAVVQSRSSSSDSISFIGNTSGPENSRSNFIRRYSDIRYGVTTTREEACELLAHLYSFINDLLGNYLYDGDSSLFRTPQNVDGFQLGMDIWRLFPCSDDDSVWICDTCGCEHHWNHNNACPTYRCKGKLEKQTYAEALDKDAHYKVLFKDTPLPLRIEEHTAQLSSERARDIQAQFIAGNVNVLSCTTTFELGVDVGDLRCVFMRNVPPATANYTQRAGRVGRRAGKPGFAVTFARLRPHDLEQFKHPERLIAGSSPVPSCYLDNEPIALRHIFAVALSEYFRFYKGSGKDCSREYNDFLDISETNPQGLETLRTWLNTHPENVGEQLSNIFSNNESMQNTLMIREWGWVDKLVGPHGRLVHTHELKHDDYARLSEAYQERLDAGKDAEASSVLKRRDNLRHLRTIQVLSTTGVLPKYGFPTDLVELHIPAQEQSVEHNALQLQRGLRQAIREYAPGNEIIADKRVWLSDGIRRPREHGLEVRRYGYCPSCKAFVWPIDNDEPTATCKICGEKVPLRQKMLIPSEGFTATRVKRNPGEGRPVRSGTLKIEYCQNWEDEKKSTAYAYPGGTVRVSYAVNAQMCAMNTNGRAGYQYCPYCGSAASGSDASFAHRHGCKNKHSVRYNALGTSFTSDVLEFRFELNGHPHFEKEAWESASWALYTVSASLLEIPSSEIGVTFYPNERNAFSIMIYDDVPGGAGHALQLAEHAEELLLNARELVSSCTCGADTCCYNCLANYYNQGRQPFISRGAALMIFETLLTGKEV